MLVKKNQKELLVLKLAVFKVTIEKLPFAWLCTLTQLTVKYFQHNNLEGIFDLKVPCFVQLCM